jgi:hypothetical protein
MVTGIDGEAVPPPSWRTAACLQGLWLGTRARHKGIAPWHVLWPALFNAYSNSLSAHIGTHDAT